MRVTGATCAANTECSGASACESMWMCGRGRTRLCCQMRHHASDDFEVEVVRNGRLYGSYRFLEHAAATLFASRLRFTFEANGWNPA
jgi:hypothetical protein